MRKADIFTVPLSKCNTYFLNYNEQANLRAFKNGISDSQLCTHDPNGSGDSCEGDSGGPIQVLHDNSTVVKILGIVSFGGSCGSTLPSINTRVAYYLDWIESIVWPDNQVNAPLPL